MQRAANAGKPWTSTEEAKLLQAFEAGTAIGELARQHGRTPQAIYGRLYRLGKVARWRLTGPLVGVAPARLRGSVNVRKPNEVRFLSGKVAGVWVVVNLSKPGRYRHGNAHVAEALRALAEAVERTDVPLADHDMQLFIGP
jgi:hypothetical protein